MATGGFVGLGLAALITIAMVTSRLRRRRRYQPDTRESDDPGRTPVVRALRIAHDSATQPDEENPATSAPLGTEPRPADLKIRDRAHATARTVLPPAEQTVLGIRDGQAVALDLAQSHGLGLLGPGAHAAARALIVTLLARAAADGLSALVVIPAADAHALLGADLPHRTPAGLRVVDDLPSALDTLEAELLARAHDEDDELDLPPDEHHARGPVVLITSSTADTERRTQAILDNGSTLGLVGVLLGQWRPGGSAMVNDDGTISATCPALTTSLSGTRLFTLPGTDTADLLALLQATEPVGDEEPAGSNDSTSDTDTSDLPHTRETSDCSSTPEPSPTQATPPEAQLGTTSLDSLSSAMEPDRVSPSSVEVRIGPPLHLQVLGRLHLTHTDHESEDVIDVLAPRQREILVYLALHRDGSRRETLTAALWPDAPTDRPYNSFHATLSQLRRGLRTAIGNDFANITINKDGHYGLDRSVVTVDLWQVQDALAARRHAATPDEKAAALQRVTELYRGDLADSIAADWIEGPREALRREILDAISGLIRTIGNDDPEQTLTLLEQARGLDPYNEAIYRDLMRTQARLGHYDSIPRTLGLLTSSLSTLDQQPTRDTVGLADVLRRPRNNQVRSKEAS